MEKEYKFKAHIIKTLSKCGDIPNAEEHFDELLKIKSEFYESQANHNFVRCMEALGNQDRLVILATLLQKDRCSCEFEAILHKSQPAISRHLSILEDAHLIRGWKKGKFIHYSVNRPIMMDILQVFQEWADGANNWFGENTGAP